MTESTKNQFDAPWYVFSSPDAEITVIENESGRVLAELDDAKTANRLAHLPELYDALEQATNEFCEGCLVKHGYLDEEHSYYDLISNGCVLNAKGCKAFPWLKLLQKVRNGE